MIFILILAGVGGWLIWDRGEMTKQIEAANLKVTEVTKKLEDSQAETRKVMMVLAKASPADAQAVAKQLDSYNGVAAGSAHSISKIVPKMSEMEKRRNQGSTMLDAPSTQPGGRR